MGDGADNMHDGITYSLAGHMLRPGGSIEDEPTDAAEKASARTAKDAAEDAQGDDNGRAYTLSHAEVGSNVRASLRAGAGA